MVYRGRVVKGMIQLSEAVELPEGAEVYVEVITANPEEYGANILPIEEKLREIVADVPQQEWNRLPKDLTDHLDHYIAPDY